MFSGETESLKSLITILYRWGYTRSLQKCNDKESGPELNIDITTHFKYLQPPTFPKKIETYYNVCRCINIPQYVQDMEMWSIDNHHNQILAYFEPDCGEQSSKALYVDAGHCPKSRHIYTHTRTYRGSKIKIHPIGPDPKSTYFKQSCSKLMKNVKLELLNGSTSQLNQNAAPISLTWGAYDRPIHFFAQIDHQG